MESRQIFTLLFYNNKLNDPPVISIVVCSINDILFENFQKSVSETIGTTYEIIKITNTNNVYCISEAYNLGAKQAKFEYLCFAHEDILFKTFNWGPLAIDLFNLDSNVGLVGIAGSKYKSLSPGGWATGFVFLDCYNLIQCYGDNKSLQVANPDKGLQWAEVKTLDGVFLFTKKIIWDNHRFDEKTFNGFHGYDLDFCLQIGQTYKLLVSYQFIIEHISFGRINRAWILSSILLSKKWKNLLPVGNWPQNVKKEVEWSEKRLFFLKMLVYKFTIFHSTKVFFDYGYLKFFNLKGNLLFIKEALNSKIKKIIYPFKKNCDISNMSIVAR